MEILVLFISVISAMLGLAMAAEPRVSVKKFPDSMSTRHFLGDQGQVILVKDAKGKLHRSPDFGSTWTDGDSSWPFASDFVTDVHPHDHHRSRVFVSTSSGKVYRSTDSGQSYSLLSIKNAAGQPLVANTLGVAVWDFHPTQPDYVLFVAGSGPCPNCHTVALASRDNGDSWVEVATYVQKCVFARDVQFMDVENDGIYCTQYNPQSGSQDKFGGKAKIMDHSLNLVLFSNFKESPKVLAVNVVEFYVFGSFLGAAVEESDGVQFRATAKGTTLNKAVYPVGAFPGFSPKAFTILQSPTKRIFLDAMVSSVYNKEMGSLFVSDASGFQFSFSLNSTNRATSGFVDYERIQQIPGMIIANQISNGDDVKKGADKVVKTLVTYNDGGSWAPLMMGSERLHFHGRSRLTPDGPIFSIKNSSVIAAVGNTGDRLGSYDTARTYYSRDGGSSWITIAETPSIHELIAYGSIMVASRSESRMGYFLKGDNPSSYKGIENWQSVSLNVGDMVVTHIVGQDEGRGNKAIFLGYSKREASEVIVSVDFSPIGDSCGANDLEPFKVSGHDCLLGKNVQFKRLKSSNCVINSDLTSPNDGGSCQCTIKSDVECDFGFYRLDNGDCMAGSPSALQQPFGCLPGTSYKATSGYRKVSSTECSASPDVDNKIKQIDRVCSGDASTPGTPPTPIDNANLPFEFSNSIDTIVYLSNSTTILAHLKDTSVWWSRDTGKTWTDTNIKAVSLIQNPYTNNIVYATTVTTTFFKFDDKDGSTTPYTQLEFPLTPNIFHAPILEFNSEDPRMIIFTGNKDCSNYASCHSQSFVTRDGGMAWTPMLEYVVDCEWGVDAEFTGGNRNRIFCLHYKDKRGGQLTKTLGSATLQYSDNNYAFGYDYDVADAVIGFAISEKFIIAAKLLPDKSNKLALQVSVDGERWAAAVFPPNVDFSSGYTVLESKSGSVTVGVLTNAAPGQEWGSIYVSNSNGTYYGLSKEFVNRDSRGYCDYERIMGVNGMAIINIVSNPDLVRLGGQKQLKTLITFNNGGSWFPLPNIADSGCSGDKCNLHLHGYTERSKIKNEMSDKEALGIFIAMGNVGEYLTPLTEADTYITIDAGVTWKKILSGPHVFEFGDHGNMLVFADARTPTKTIKYSFDFGRTIGEMSLNSPHSIQIDRFVTEPDGSSYTFILVGNYEGSSNTISIHIDFSEKLPRQCVMDTNDAEKSDYELVKFKDRDNDECVFGHVTQYKRRKQDRQCYTGELFEGPTPTTLKNCECKDEDYECSPGYYRNADQKCVKIDGFVEGYGECEADGYMRWSHPYRKSSLTTCEGGKVLDQASSKWCKQGLSPLQTTLIVVFLVPVVLLIAFGLFAYRKMQRGEQVEMPSWISEAIDKIRNLIPERYRPGEARYEIVAQDDTGVLMDDY